MTQGNFFTGTNAGGNGLEVTDGSTTNFDVNKIILGTGLSITSSVGRTVTLQSAGSGGGIGGSIAATQVAYGTGVDTIGGEAAFTYTAGTNTLDVGVITTTGTGISVGGTGTITTNNGSISAVGGQVVAAGVPNGLITGSGLVVAENSILKGTFTDFTSNGDIFSEGGALLLSQLGQSRWCSNPTLDMNTATGCIDLSLIQYRGAQMQITADAGGLVINAYAPTAPGGAVGTITAVIGDAGQTKQIAGVGQAIQIAIAPFETVVLQVAGDLSNAGDYGYIDVTDNLGSGVLVVLGKCTLTAV